MASGKTPKNYRSNRTESSSDSDMEHDCGRSVEIREERNDSRRRSHEISSTDFYCRLCKTSMNSNLTWKMHVSGKMHAKKLAEISVNLRKSVKVPSQNRSAFTTYTVKVSDHASVNISTRPGKEQAYIQQKFEDITDQAVVGLDFMKEIWRIDSSFAPAYICSLCDSEFQSFTIVNHVTGFRHRIQYLKQIDKSAHEQLSFLHDRKSVIAKALSRHAERLEQKYGKGTVQVLHEVTVQSEEHPGESGDAYGVRLPIVENPQSMESETLPRQSFEPRDPTIVQKTPVEPLPIDIRNVPPKDVAEAFAALENPVSILKAFVQQDTLSNERVSIEKINRSSPIDLYIQQMIRKMPEDTKCHIIEELNWKNNEPLLEYFQVKKITANFQSLLERNEGSEKTTE